MATTIFPITDEKHYKAVLEAVVFFVFQTGMLQAGAYALPDFVAALTARPPIFGPPDFLTLQHTCNYFKSMKYIIC